jgi:hypothetical protein
MKTIEKIIYTGFAACALASASMPAFSWTVGREADWNNTFGRPGYSAEILPEARAGYAWSPGHFETRGNGQVWVEGVYVQDDSGRQWRTYSNGREVIYSDGPPEIRDRDGNVIPTNPEAYPIESTRR